MSNEEIEFDGVDAAMTAVLTHRKSDANWLTSVHGSFTISFRYPLPLTKTRQERKIMLSRLKTILFTGGMILLTAPGVLAAPTVKQLANNVYMMSEFHYTSLVVVGEDGVLITDPAFPGRAQSLKRAIADITDKPVTRIVLSHEHYDHVGGTGVFPEAQVICHAACQTVFDLDVGGVVPEKVDVTFTDSLRVDFRGPPVYLHYYGPGDGFASIVVHLPEERVAFTADLYDRRALTPGKWMDDANYLAILRVLKELQKKNLRHAVNAHSEDTSVAIVDENVKFVSDLFNLVNGEIRKAMEAGGLMQVMTSLETWARDLKLPHYADWEGYDEHLPAHVRRMTYSIFHGG